MGLNMLPFARSAASSRYRRVLSSQYRSVRRKGASIWRKSMATLTRTLPEQPDLIADLDSHLFAALRWPIQKRATLGDLSYEFDANANRVLDIPLPYESTPSLSRRLTFDKPGSSDDHHGIVMVAHCIGSRKDSHPRNAKIKLSSGFVIGSGLIVTCAHTFEEVSPSYFSLVNLTGTGSAYLGPEVSDVFTHR